MFLLDRNGQHLAVLGILVQQNSSQLYYDISPLLISRIPQQTVDALISQGLASFFLYI
jgi:hypothetical protein